MKSALTDIGKAVMNLIEEYGIARENGHVQKPISYALYQTWKRWDKSEKTEGHESPTSCSTCILDNTDACTRGAGRAVDDDACEDYLVSPTEAEVSEE